MKSFDVVVVGGGPAGGQCARLLAKSGHKVLLVEQQENFDKNDFSSAATPLETLEQFALPQEVVGSTWQKLVLVTTNISRSWESTKSLGLVLNFAKLRKFLASEVEGYGSEVWLGYRYIKYACINERVSVTLNQRGGTIVTVDTKVLVDATGPARAVMSDKHSNKPDYLEGTGIEYLIEVAEEDYNKYSNTLFFFLGYKWMPKGYSWIFPMEKNRLKVGAACLRSDHKLVARTEAIRYYIQLLIKEYIKPKEYKIIDIHGSTLKYSMGLNDVYYKDSTIAIGDAVSTVNFLGGEGIRHAMHSAEIAYKHINHYLKNQDKDFRSYQQEMLKAFAPKWDISAKMGMRRYLVDSDEKIDKGVAYLSALKIEDMMDILFYYKFEKLSKGLGGYLMRKVRSLVQAFVKG